MRINKRTNIAVRVLMFCEVNNGRLVTKSEIAQACDISENHLAQVINQLARLGFLRTHRGRNGGVELGRAAGDIVIGDVFRAMEGHTPVSECFADADNSCPLVAACRLRLAVRDAVEAFYASLDMVTLDTLVCGNDPLKALLALGPCLTRAKAGS
ncbi:RrF2 family transcriptional regulator [Aquicoccus sp. G2-2]|uniref:RrF2 family transcriptional regulator n=1 Tax=Aquicoccus sp. G2-2 TaxID=3092120 RepID=UPI002AE095F7|nr:Rrf2 family transcriptional regulator [Aquicoccus sp. G2-2]MEA1112670.1 Rrf2 family transcriptional regulator [Aquicoccus sp. G2-2]